MNAIQAKQISQENRTVKDVSQFKDIMSQIENAAKSGEYSIRCDNLTQANVIKFKDLGYQVFNFKNECSIYWTRGGCK